MSTENYFREIVHRYHSRLLNWEKQSLSAPQKERIGIVITPWLDTAVPLYSIEIACGLRAKGYNIVFLFDPIQLPVSRISDESMKAFRSLKATLKHFGEVLEVPAGKKTGNEKDYIFLAHENAVWWTKGERGVPAFFRKNSKFVRNLASHALTIRNVLRRAQLKWVLIPGGVFGVSGLYTAEAAKLDLDFSTYDCGHGRFFLTHRGVAAHSTDVPVAHTLLDQACKENQKLKNWVLYKAKEMFLKRENGGDFFSFQKISRRGNVKSKFDLLICLNYRADTAALLRARCFSTVEEWVTAVARWALKHGFRLAVRAHPSLRSRHIRSVEQIDKLLAKIDTTGDRIVWIGPHEDVNTYDLVDHSQVILPFTSTIGIEAVFMGRPVVLCARSYYDNLGIARACSTSEEYFSEITMALKEKKTSSCTMRETAMLCYYLVCACRSVYSNFTPQPLDFEKWINEPIDKLWSRPELADLVESLITRIPIAWLRHQRLYYEEVLSRDNNNIFYG